MSPLYDFEFSIVIACFNEEKTIEDFISRLTKEIRLLHRSIEIVAVDDGSKDRTFGLLSKLTQSHPELSVAARLFKNSGQAAAITAGLSLARGKNYILIDSDLQLLPEELPILVKRYDEGADLVTGFRKNRKDLPSRKFFSLVANHLMRRASGTNTKDFGCTFKVINGDLVRACQYGPFKVIRMAQVLSLAGSIAEVPVTHLARPHGKSGWTFIKLFNLFIENLTGATGTTFQKIALFTLVLALMFVVRVIVAFWLPGGFVREVTTGLILNTYIAGTLLLVGLICLLGEISGRTYRSTSGRPIFVVAEKICLKSR